MSGGSEDPRDRQAGLSERDQTSGDADQSAADLDATAADVDQTSAERDQHAADRDQRSADSDQVTIDDPQGPRADAESRARTRADRAQSSLDRDLSAHTRSEATRVRDATAMRRDRFAAERDASALARDQLAAALDAEIEDAEAQGRSARGGRGAFGLDRLQRAAGDRRSATAIRARAEAQREAAAEDRAVAGRDREQAALDRQAAAEEVAMEGIDYLTGALSRRAGAVAIQREMDRAARAAEPLVVAFVDVDGLKAVNDARGHGAGDDLLRTVARCIREGTRSYDVLVRFGGDEFVCLVAGGDAPDTRRSFEAINDRLARELDGATFRVGFAERRPDDTLDELIARADAAMIAVR